MSSTVVVLVRHGKTPTTGKVLPGRARGLHLSEAGKLEAERTAVALVRMIGRTPDGADGMLPGVAKGNARRNPTPPEIAAVYSSPMERARETARPIAAAFGLRVTPERNLIECDFGEWTGKSLAALRKLSQWKKLLADPTSFRFPGGESISELQSRVRSALEAFRSRHPGKVVVAVTHADPIRIAVADALGAHLSNMHRVWVSTASVSILSFGAGAPAVLAVNLLGELPVLRGSS